MLWFDSKALITWVPNGLVLRPLSNTNGKRTIYIFIKLKVSMELGQKKDVFFYVIWNNLAKKSFFIPVHSLCWCVCLLTILISIIKIMVFSQIRIQTMERRNQNLPFFCWIDDLWRESDTHRIFLEEGTLFPTLVCQKGEKTLTKLYY